MFRDSVRTDLHVFNETRSRRIVNDSDIVSIDVQTNGK